ncbi:MAG: EAL domain-containing protein [Thermoanaerobaculia bacterium]
MTAGARTSPRLRSGRPSILLLDDDPEFARVVQGALPSSRYEVAWMRSVTDALASVAPALPDVVVLEPALDGRDGLDFLRMFRERTQAAAVPVIVATAAEDTVRRLAALRRGADRYLVKPVAPETLRRIVDEILRASGDDLWWTVNAEMGEVETLRRILFDPTTNLPTLAAITEPVRALLLRDGRLDVYCITLEPLIRIEERSAWEAFDALRREFARGLQVVVASTLGNETMAATTYVGSNETYLFAPARAGGERSETARELEAHSRRVLETIPSAFPRDEISIFAGSSTAELSFPPAHRVLYDAIREARDTAERRETRYRQTLSRQLVRAIRQKSIRTLFQPIVDLATERAVGYEALSRGPSGSDIESPEVMFELARDFQLVWDLESLCLENIAPLLGSVCATGQLFFNLEPHFIQQLQARGLSVLEPLNECDDQVVIEITERSAIRDYPEFRRTIHQLKQMGFHIAIDDCGSGYSTLEAIAELRPDYIKIGTSLLANVETDPVRRELVGLLSRCASGIGAITIAEAIETEKQLAVCRELGVDAGQGYYFARPARWEDIAAAPKSG